MSRAPHFVVAGWDETTARAARYLVGLGLGVTVIVSALPTLSTVTGSPRVAPTAGMRIVRGAPSRRKTLEDAEVGTAIGLLAALPADQLARVSSAARRLNPAIRIVASTADADSRPDAWAAGAEAAIDTREEAGKQLAALALASGPDPRDPDAGISLGVLAIAPGSAHAWAKLAEARARADGLTVAALMRGGIPADVTTADDAVVTPGDALVLLGARADLVACGAREYEVTFPPPESEAVSG